PEMRQSGSKWRRFWAPCARHHVTARSIPAPWLRSPEVFGKRRTSGWARSQARSASQSGSQSGSPRSGLLSTTMIGEMPTCFRNEPTATRTQRGVWCAIRTGTIDAGMRDFAGPRLEKAKRSSDGVHGTPYDRGSRAPRSTAATWAVGPGADFFGPELEEERLVALGHEAGVAVRLGPGAALGREPVRPRGVALESLGRGADGVHVRLDDQAGDAVL